MLRGCDYIREKRNDVNRCVHLLGVGGHIFTRDNKRDNKKKLSRDKIEARTAQERALRACYVTPDKKCCVQEGKRKVRLRSKRK